MISAAEVLRRQWRDSGDRLSRRLEGLTDAEHYWKPAPSCWTVRPNASVPGKWEIDYDWPPPEPAPLTTIAWRVVHLANGNWIYWEHAFGPGERMFPDLEIPGTADGARSYWRDSREPISAWAAGALAGRGRAARPGERLRGVPDRPARGRGRPARAPAVGGPRTRGGRHGGRRRGRLRSRRAGRHRVAAAHLRAVPLLPARCREPVPRVPVHRLGRRRRLRRVRRGAGRLRVPAAGGVLRRRARAAAVRRHHRLPCIAPGRAASGWNPWRLRVRGLGPPRRPGGARARGSGTRADPLRGGAQAGHGARRVVGRGRHGPAAGAAGRRDPVRTRG